MSSSIHQNCDPQAHTYTIPAIPTVYRGRRYRSRLEARWAAFFDLLGWQYEYEPLDLGTWSPDFALWGKRAHYPTLVEIKPIDRWDRTTARKMADASFDRRLLLLGVSPFFDTEWTSIGYWGEPALFEANWDDALLGKALDGRFDLQPNGATICPESMFWEFCYDLEPFDAKPLWIEAANRVQWHPKEAKL